MPVRVGTLMSQKLDILDLFSSHVLGKTNTILKDWRLRRVLGTSTP